MASNKEKSAKNKSQKFNFSFTECNCKLLSKSEKRISWLRDGTFCVECISVERSCTNGFSALKTLNENQWWRPDLTQFYYKKYLCRIYKTQNKIKNLESILKILPKIIIFLYTFLPYFNCQILIIEWIYYFNIKKM